MHARDFYILPRPHQKRRAGDSVHYGAIMHDQTSREHAPNLRTAQSVSAVILNGYL